MVMQNEAFSALNGDKFESVLVETVHHIKTQDNVVTHLCDRGKYFDICGKCLSLAMQLLLTFLSLLVNIWRP